MNNTPLGPCATPDPPPWLIFTDLDGTLLDHHTYSFVPARQVLAQLRQRQIPVLCCTSKTFAEVVPLRRQLNNSDPFIVENGAGVYLPLSLVPEKMLQTLGPCSLHEGFWRFDLDHSRDHWQQVLRAIGPQFDGLYASFQQLGNEGIARVTGLSVADAALANHRQYSEPLLWLGDEDSKIAFVSQLHKFGASVLLGGRFMHITGSSNKGRALHWLQDVFTTTFTRAYKTIAAGDGRNDIAMLEAADYALIVRSPTNPPPEVHRTQNLWISKKEGPAGWAAGLTEILQLDTPSTYPSKKD